MNRPIYRTIKSAIYTPAAERTDGVDHQFGDVTYVRFEECEHVMFGNPVMTYRRGDTCVCWKCAAEEES